jgi:hypothetical protein
MDEACHRRAGLWLQMAPGHLGQHRQRFEHEQPDQHTDDGQ